MTDAAISKVVFGTAALGLAYGLGRDGGGPTLMNENLVATLVDCALAHGITTFDTAPAYGLGEERLGRSLGARGAIWTKLGSSGEGDSDARVAELEASLKRLQRRSIDLLQWHNWDYKLAQNAMFLDTWHRMRADERVKSLGATTYGSRDALAAVESGLFDTVQVEFNLLNRSVLDAIKTSASEYGVSIAVRSVLLQGALTDAARTLPPDRELHRAVNQARQLAHSHGLRLEQLALRVALAEPAIRYVIIGFDAPQQIEDVVQEARCPDEIPWDEVHALDLGGTPSTDPRTW